jgi:mannose-1-phosphate guanylyltransferase
MILFNVKIFKNLLKKVNPVMEKLIFDTNISDEEKFDQIEAVSIDNGLIEKINDVYSVNLTNYWTDL